MLMGNRSQLGMANTVKDSLILYKEIYGVSQRDFQNRLDELVEMLELSGLLQKQARNLSLGERSKCELVLALIHKPDILYLDEPTLGMDVTMQLHFREYIKRYNEKYGATVILTSHYMSDISSLCPRVMLIHKGKLVYDGNLPKLADKIAPYKLVKLTYTDKTDQANDIAALLHAANLNADVMERDDHNITLRVKKEDALSVVSFCVGHGQTLSDMTMENPPVEAVIDQVYRKGVDTE